MEYHFVTWQLYASNRRRHAVLERDVYFEERIISYPNFIISEFVPADAERGMADSIRRWIAEWKEKGEKWDWDDEWTPTIIRVPNEDELCKMIKSLLTDTPEHKKRLCFHPEDKAVLKRHFSDEEVENLLPDHMKPPSPPKPPPRGKRTAYLGLTPSKYYRIPLIIDLDKLCPKHIAFIGASGNGKTIAAYDLAEEALLSNIPVLVLDPTGAWTGFLEPCTDRAMLSKYKEFNIAGPRAFPGKVYTPDSDLGLPINANLLAKPSVVKESELMAYAKEVSDFVAVQCNLSSGEQEEVRSTIFDSWKNGEDLDYKSIVEKVEDKKIKKKLGNLVAARFLFEGEGLENISELWRRGEISIVTLNFIKEKGMRMIASYYVLRELINYFDSLGTTDDQEEKLRLLLVVEETSLFDKSVIDMLDIIARTMRKRGLGLLLVTQRLVDLGEIQANINTKAYMRTAHKPDIERAAIELGELAETLTNMQTGTGIFFSPDYGQPVLTEFRPCMHRNRELTEDEIRRKMNVP